MIKSNSSPSIPLHNYFDTIKWKKRFHKLSHKFNYSRNNNNNNNNSTTSATTMAAATEKFIRKSSYDTTIHSEDLTASQFAHLTGIDRKRATSICCSSSTTDDDDSDDLESDDDGYSSPHHYSTVGPTVCIWDDHFWQNANNKTLPFPTKEEIVKNECITRTPTCHSVQKGRFKIIWGQQQENYNEIVTVPAPSSKCVEWKRKRANTCDTTFSKKSL